MVVKKENKKLKVVWICGFTNSFVQDKLRPLKRTGEIAPWISNLIGVFENDPDLELHIISPHTGIPHIKSFEHNEIRYHFLPQGIPLIGLKWPSFFSLDLWTDYFFIKKYVKKLVDEINPDIIHLHGAENTYHTASITQFKDKYPILVTVQGFINNSRSNNKRVIRRKKREKDIYNLFSHFTYRTKTMIRQIEQFRPDANVYFLRYPRKKIVPLDVEKKYDLVYFGRLSKDKGIQDLISVLAMLKSYKTDISLLLIGSGNNKSFKDLAQALNVDNHITWAGFLPTQEDMHKLASKAKITVVPTYHDTLPGTVTESLFLKLPIVAYDVGSIPEINKKEKIISLVEKGNLEKLYENIVEFLNNSILREERAVAGRNYAMEYLNDQPEVVKDTIIDIYGNVIDQFEIEAQKT